jgi:protein transporter SFT1
MERARTSLKRTMGRLNIAYRQAQSNHMLLLVLFALGLFISIYVISKIYKLGRHIVG